MDAAIQPVADSMDFDAACLDFILNHRDHDVPFYERIRDAYDTNVGYVLLKCNDIRAYSIRLPVTFNGSQSFMDVFTSTPATFIAGMERAATQVLLQTHASVPDTARVQIVIDPAGEPSQMISEVSSANVNRLMVLRGVVSSSFRIGMEFDTAAYTCTTCSHTVRQPATAVPPRSCTADGCPGQYDLSEDLSTFQDAQYVRMQELPEENSTGEVAATITFSVRRHLVNTIMPGARILAVVVNSPALALGRKEASAATNVRDTSFSDRFMCLGFSSLISDTGSMGDVAGARSAAFGPGAAARATPYAPFTEYERAAFQAFANDAHFYDTMRACICPNIHGHDIVKDAIALMLVGGCKKIRPEGVTLKGDVNVLLLGDPGTAKSEMLSWASKVAPIGVFTSGKGSSAAGLTAAVNRDTVTGEYFLDAGAMVLADGGLVCLDEFDKMSERDRVAIHEAMEQQTVSISKAGIVAKLNTRTAVFAAANPMLGRIDDFRELTEQIGFLPTILSRFDAIFLIRDRFNRDTDMALARYVAGGAQRDAQHPPPPRDLAFLRRYVAYARSTYTPIITMEVVKYLTDVYVRIRSEQRARAQNAVSAIPITVRQAEALVRLTEASAKLQLRSTATIEDARRAERIFLASTYTSAIAGTAPNAAESDLYTAAQLRRAEEYLTGQVPVNSVVKIPTLLQTMATPQFNLQRGPVLQAVRNLVGSGMYTWVGNNAVKRLRSQ